MKIQSCPLEEFTMKLLSMRCDWWLGWHNTIPKRTQQNKAFRTRFIPSIPADIDDVLVEGYFHWLGANNESSEVVDILLPVTCYFNPSTKLDNV